MARRSSASHPSEGRQRGARLDFRVDSVTKTLVERAAALERRSLTDFCLTALVDAARESVLRHEHESLSPRDRAVFFDTLVRAPKPNARLKRAAKAERERVQK